jgi:hypothetical protein
VGYTLRKGGREGEKEEGEEGEEGGRRERGREKERERDDEEEEDEGELGEGIIPKILHSRTRPLRIETCCSSQVEDFKQLNNALSSRHRCRVGRRWFGSSSSQILVGLALMTVNIAHTHTHTYRRSHTHPAVCLEITFW